MGQWCYDYRLPQSIWIRLLAARRLNRSTPAVQ
jgi:hypothetical protein